MVSIVCCKDMLDLRIKIKAHFIPFYFVIHSNCIIFACKNKKNDRNFSDKRVNNCYICNFACSEAYIAP